MDPNCDPGATRGLPAKASQPAISTKSMLLIASNIILPLLSILLRRHRLLRKLLRIFGDLHQNRNTPPTPSPRPQALRHLTSPLRLRTQAKINQLTHRNVIAVANFVVRIHIKYSLSDRTNPASDPKVIRKGAMAKRSAAMPKRTNETLNKSGIDKKPT